MTEIFLTRILGCDRKMKAVMQQGAVLNAPKNNHVIHPSCGVISCLSAALEIKTDCCVTEYIFQRRRDYTALCHNI